VQIRKLARNENGILLLFHRKLKNADDAGAGVDEQESANSEKEMQSRREFITSFSP
jgi:hypothetical protein